MVWQEEGDISPLSCTRACAPALVEESLQPMCFPEWVMQGWERREGGPLMWRRGPMRAHRGRWTASLRE